MTADVAFRCMGSGTRLLVDSPQTAAAARAFLEEFEARLSRFRPASELCRLNADPRERVPASPLLRLAVRAGVWAAERTGGLVDPTLVGALEAAGYTTTRRAPELALAEALATAPPRAPAHAHPDAGWRAIRVDTAAITRPPNLRFDTGGTGKGLAADLLAARLEATPHAWRPAAALWTTPPEAGGGAARGTAASLETTPPQAGGGDVWAPAATLGTTPPEAGGGAVWGPAASRRGTVRGRRWAIDCGGDIRVSAPAADPFCVDARHPLTGEVMHELTLARGAVATSGIDVRLWRGPGGKPAHHLLDPATGAPAWTGLIGATALAPTALEAEALPKAALLSGPRGAGRWLSAHGGLAVREDGEVEPFGPLRPRPVIRIRVPA